MLVMVANRFIIEPIKEFFWKALVQCWLAGAAEYSNDTEYSEFINKWM